MMLNFIVRILLVSLLSNSQVHAGGGITGGATEWTQIANNVELIGQVRAQIDTFQTLQQELQLLMENEALLATHNILNSFDSPLVDLHRALVNDGAISYTAENLNEEFDREYPGYQTYARETYGVDTSNTNYARWSKQNHSNIKAALNTIGVNRDQVITESKMLDTLARQAKTVKSKKAVLQLGNDIALTQAQQNRRMEHLLETQIALQGNYLAAEQSKEDRAQVEADNRSDYYKNLSEMLRKRRE